MLRVLLLSQLMVAMLLPLAAAGPSHSRIVCDEDVSEEPAPMNQGPHASPSTAPPGAIAPPAAAVPLVPAPLAEPESAATEVATAAEAVTQTSSTASWASHDHGDLRECRSCHQRTYLRKGACCNRNCRDYYMWKNNWQPAQKGNSSELWTKDAWTKACQGSSHPKRGTKGKKRSKNDYWLDPAAYYKNKKLKAIEDAPPLPISMWEEWQDWTPQQYDWEDWLIGSGSHENSSPSTAPYPQSSSSPSSVPPASMPSASVVPPWHNMEIATEVPTMPFPTWEAPTFQAPAPNDAEAETVVPVQQVPPPAPTEADPGQPGLTEATVVEPLTPQQLREARLRFFTVLSTNFRVLWYCNWQ